VLGIEPAANVAAVAERDHGVPTLRAFFGEALGEELAACGQLADIVHANNVVAHVPDVVGFFSGLHAVLAPAGVAILETPHLVSMLQSAQFDTIYHEHVFYWSLTAMAAVAERVGLAIVEVERVDVHGGSLRVTLARAGERSVSSSVAAVLAEEEAAGIFDDATYRRFATRSGQVARELRAAVRVLRATKRRVAAYGASAKGAVMLHAAGLGRSHLRYVVDKSPHKIGRFVPGAGVPIVSPEVLRASPPDDLLLLVWNLRDEVVAENAWFLAQGGRILVPGANGGRLEIITSDKPHPGWERVA
jgi:SAM-dependent methyltransferase